MARRDHGKADRQRDRPGQWRCAVYTRKSTEEGLEQDFNSLDARREACEAFIRSQKSEGWVLVPGSYDDGGLSGGTLERPALQRLLADIREGRVDIVVVYKVDRLTRSLADFAKLVETFDAAGASSVSVTQAFNTSTSMGRPTLNMLLSFAQFEREGEVETAMGWGPIAHRTPSGSATRSPPRSSAACGWAGRCRAALTPSSGGSSSTGKRPRPFA